MNNNLNFTSLSGKAAHGGVALLWKVAIDDNIKSDPIVGIQCDLPGYELLFITGAYLPSAIYIPEEYRGYCTIPCLQIVKSFSRATLMVI